MKHEIILYAWISNKNSNQNFKINQMQKRVFNFICSDLISEDFSNFKKWINSISGDSSMVSVLFNDKVVHSLEMKKNKVMFQWRKKTHLLIPKI